MILRIFFNNDGFLGGWATTQETSCSALTAEIISRQKEKGFGVFVEMTMDQVQLFHKTIDCRDRVEILPMDSDKFDASFGSLNLKFNDFQKEKDLKITKEAHLVGGKDNFSQYS
jgi:hypothetical protein